MLAWLFVWSEVQTCIQFSWCHCHSLSLASVKSRLVLPFCYWLTWVVPDKGPLNGCVWVCVCVFCYHKDSLFLMSEKCLLSDCSPTALTNGLLYVTLQSLLRSDTLCCVVQRWQSHWCHPRSFPAVVAHVTCTTISATFEPKWPPTRKSVYATFSYRSLTLAGFNLLYFIKVACSKNVL